MKQKPKGLSNDTLHVLPGYTIDNNIGNPLFIFGRNPPWPPSPVQRPS